MWTSAGSDHEFASFFLLWTKDTQPLGLWLPNAKLPNVTWNVSECSRLTERNDRRRQWVWQIEGEMKEGERSEAFWIWSKVYPLLFGVRVGIMLLNTPSKRNSANDLSDLMNCCAALPQGDVRPGLCSQHGSIETVHEKRWNFLIYSSFFQKVALDMQRIGFETNYVTFWKMFRGVICFLFSVTVN